MDHITNSLINQLSFTVKDSAPFYLYEYESHNQTDIEYINFIKSYRHGSFFYNGSLQIYGCSSAIHYDIRGINDHIIKSYGRMVAELCFFACDIFGIQFCFRNRKIYSFDLESGKISFIANSFIDWIDLILNDSEFMTGEPYKRDFETKHGPVLLKQKILPIRPFVIGGEYKVENFIAYDFLDLINYNSQIAHQIYNLPDGTKVNIKY